MMFFTYMAALIIDAKNNDIKKLDDLISILGDVKIMLSNSAPSTNDIIKKLSSNERYSLYDFDDFSSLLLFDNDTNIIIKNALETIGRYDIKTQLSIINECREQLIIIKDDRKEKLNKNKRLYLTLGCSTGCVIALLFI